MKSYQLLIVPALFISLQSCTKDSNETASISDVSLSSLTSSEDLSFARSVYVEDGDWQIKMNSVAATASSEGLKSFPSNSMIVKEKRDGSGKVLSYAVMYKAPADPNSVDGWLWSEYDADGHTIYSAAEGSISCKGCHAALNRGHQ